MSIAVENSYGNWILLPEHEAALIPLHLVAFIDDSYFIWEGDLHRVE